MKVKGVPCPKCGKKTLSHPDNPKWSAWKEYSKAVCRSCGSKFKEKKE